MMQMLLAPSAQVAYDIGVCVCCEMRDVVVQAHGGAADGVRYGGVQRGTT
jgi:hypothetical protein